MTDKKLTTKSRPTYADAFDAKVMAQYPIEAQRSLIELIKSAESKNTKKATAQAVRHYVEVWKGPLPCTPTDLALYLDRYARKPTQDGKSNGTGGQDRRKNKDLQGFSIATLEQRRSLFGTWHERTFGDNPNNSDAVRETMRSIRVSCGGNLQSQAKALPMRILERAEEELRKNREVALAHDDRQSLLKFSRNRALLLTAFWFGFRASELINLRIGSVQMSWDEERPRMQIFVPRSKTDRQGQGRKINFKAMSIRELCPMYALRQWLEDRFQGVEPDQAKDSDLPLFAKVDRWGNVWTDNIHINSMNQLLETLFTVDTQTAQDRYTSHSMRRGLANWMLDEGGRLKDLMDWIGWNDTRSALRYVDARESAPTTILDEKLARARRNKPDN